MARRNDSCLVDRQRATRSPIGFGNLLPGTLLLRLALVHFFRKQLSVYERLEMFSIPEANDQPAVADQINTIVLMVSHPHVELVCVPDMQQPAVLPVQDQ